MFLELPPLPSGPIAAPEVSEEIAGEHGVELEEEIVGGHIQMERLRVAISSGSIDRHLEENG